MSLARSLCLVLLLCLYSEMQLSSDFQVKRVHRSALNETPAPFAVTFSQVIRNYPLHRHSYVDFNATISDIDSQDQHFLYSTDNLPNIVQLTPRKLCQVFETTHFTLVINNPTSIFTLCFESLFIDRPQLQLTTQFKPFCIKKQKNRTFTLVIHPLKVQELFLALIVIKFKLKINEVTVEQKLSHLQFKIKITPNQFNITHIAVYQNSTPFTFTNFHSDQAKISIDALNDTSLFQENKITLKSKENVTFFLSETQKTITIQSLFKKQIKNYIIPIVHKCSIAIQKYYLQIVTEQKTAIQYPIFVTNGCNRNIQIKSIDLNSTNHAVQLIIPKSSIQINASTQRVKVGNMIVRSNYPLTLLNMIQIKITYTKQHSQHIDFTTQTFQYYEIRMPISVGQRRFIDVNKGNGVYPNLIGFPVRNLLNVPLRLTHIHYDHLIFKINKISEWANYIYPNQHLQEFTLGFINDGQILPKTHSILLEFNHHILIPIQIVLYNHNLAYIQETIIFPCSKINYFSLSLVQNIASTNYLTSKIIIYNPNPIGIAFDLSIQPNNNAINVSFVLINNQNISTKWFTSNQTLSSYLKYKQSAIINIKAFFHKYCLNPRINLNLRTNFNFITFRFDFERQQIDIYSLKQYVQNINIFKIQSLVNHCLNYLSQNKLQTTQLHLIKIDPWFHFIQNNHWNRLALNYYIKTRNKNITHFCCLSQYVIILYQRQHFSTANVILYKGIPSQIKQYKGKKIRSQTNVLVQSKNQKYKSTFKMNNTLIYNSVLHIHNPYNKVMKYSVYLLSDMVNESIFVYKKQIKSLKNQKRTHFCMTNWVMEKHSLTAQSLKSLFQLNKVPIELSIDRTKDNVFYLYAQKIGRVVVNRNQLSRYVLSALNAGVRTCFQFTTYAYIKKLIESEVVNAVAQLHSTTVLQLFIRYQLHNVIYNQFYQHYNKFYSNLNIDFASICQSNTQLRVFRFCRTLPLSLFIQDANSNLQSVQGKELILKPNANTSLLLKWHNSQPKQITFSLVVANNITSFQSYEMSLSVVQPLIGVQGGKDINSSKEEGGVIIVVVNGSQGKNEVMNGVQKFYILNEGHAPFHLNHIGIGQDKYSCHSQGIRILGLTCNKQFNSTTPMRSQHPLTIKENSRLQVQIAFKLFYNDSIHSKDSTTKRTIYLYDEYNNFYAIKVIFQLPQRKKQTSLLRYVVLALCSIGLIVASMRTQWHDEGCKRDKMGNMGLEKRLLASSKVVRVPLKEKSLALSLAVPVCEVNRLVHLSSRQQFKKYFDDSEESGIAICTTITDDLNQSVTEDFQLLNKVQIQIIDEEQERQSNVELKSILQNGFIADNLVDSGNKIRNRTNSLKDNVESEGEKQNSKRKEKKYYKEKKQKRNKKYQNKFEENQGSERIVMKQNHEKQKINQSNSISKKQQDKEQYKQIKKQSQIINILQEIKQNYVKNEEQKNKEQNVIQNRQNNKECTEKSQINRQQISSNSDSELPQGEQVDSSLILSASQYGFGITQAKLIINKKQENTNRDDGYYNVFSSQNPLKSSGLSFENPFPWIDSPHSPPIAVKTKQRIIYQLKIPQN